MAGLACLLAVGGDLGGGRRALVTRSALAATSGILAPAGAPALYTEPPPPTRRPPSLVSSPLSDCGGSYCTVFEVDGQPFRAVIDTGSPFLTVAGSCTKRWGCYTGQGAPADLPDTYERYEGREGNVHWRRGYVTMGEGRGRFGGQLTFGVLSDELVGRPGGVFLGLVKREAAGIRPSFLSQTHFVAFRLDLRDEPRLDLSSAPLVPSDANAMPLVDLRPMGSPVEHYAVRASRLSVDGSELTLGDGRPVYAIFDTGTTGLAMSVGLWDAAIAQYMMGAPAPWTGTFAVDMPTKHGQVRVEVERPFPTTPIAQVPWAKFDAHLVVLGLAFMQQRALTVDCDKRAVWLGY